MSLMVQTGHSGGFYSIDVSPDGSQYATAGKDSVVRIWESRTGRQLFALAGHTDYHLSAITSVRYSGDGRSIVSCSDMEVIVWSATTGERLLTLEWDVTEEATWAELSRDGTIVVTGGSLGATRFWNRTTGALLDEVNYAANDGAVSPDGSMLANAGTGGIVRILNTESRSQVNALHCGNEVNSVVFSPDGSMIVIAGELNRTMSKPAIVRAWATANWKLLYTIEDPLRSFDKIAFAPDSSKFATTSSATDVVRVWDSASGRLLDQIDSQLEYVWDVDFALDGTLLSVGTRAPFASYNYLSTGFGRIQASRVSRQRSLSISEDGSFFITGSGGVHVWNADFSYRTLQYAEDCQSVAVSLDGTFIATGDDRGVVRIRDAETGSLIQTMDLVALEDSILSESDYRTHEDRRNVNHVEFSSEGSRFLASMCSVVHVWTRQRGGQQYEYDAEISRQQRIISDEYFDDPHFSPDGSIIMNQGFYLTSYDFSTGDLVNWEHLEAATARQYSPDGSRVVTGYWNGEVQTWNAETKSGPIKNFLGHTDSVYSAVYSHDGSKILTSSSDNTARVWDAETGSSLAVLSGHSRVVLQAFFTQDDSHIVTLSLDNTIRVWKTETGEEVCALVSFEGGGWAVTTPDGRYDLSNTGNTDDLYWVYTDSGRGILESIDLDQLKDEYYTPGLFAQVVGYREAERALPIPIQERALKLFPSTTVERNGDIVTVTARNRGGGIGAVEVFLNGKSVLRKRPNNPSKDEFTFIIDTSEKRYSRLLIPEWDLAEGVTNNIRAEAYNYDAEAVGNKQYWSSRSKPVNVPPPPVTTAHKPKVYILAAGVSDYVGNGMDLKFAAKDARDFADATTAAAVAWVGEENVETHLLVSDEIEDGAKPATKENIKAAFEKISETARLTDIFIVFLSGHGVSAGSASDEYYYLTADAADANLQLLSADVARKTITGAELSAWMLDVPAAKQALVLDTCPAGAVASLSEDKSVTGDLKRSWERLKDRGGVFVLAGCAANSVSYEASVYGQGLLTYSLLEGLKRDDGILRTDGETKFIDLFAWFSYAEDRVPQLTREAGIGGVQKPELKSVKYGARTFDVGVMNDVVRAKVRLEEPRPVVLPSLPFPDENDRRLNDTLGLAKAINALDKSSGTRGGNPGVSVWKVDEHPGAYVVGGKYSLLNGTLTVTVFVDRWSDPLEGALEPSPIEEFVLVTDETDVVKVAEEIWNKAAVIIAEDHAKPRRAGETNMKPAMNAVHVTTTPLPIRMSMRALPLLCLSRLGIGRAPRIARSSRNVLLAHGFNAPRAA